MFNLLFETELKMTMRALARLQINFTPGELIDLVCNALNIAAHDLCGPIRKRELVEARFITCQLLQEFSYLSEAEIAPIIKKDRSTVYYALEQFQSLQSDIEFAHKCSQVYSYLP